MDKFSHPLLIIIAVRLIAVTPQSYSQSESTEAAPAPTVDCMPYFLNVTDCIDFVTPGSNASRPPQVCCTEFATLVNEQPICLCELLRNPAALPLPVDVNRALQLPNLCDVTTPPVSTCAAFGIPVPPSSAPAEPTPPPPPDDPYPPLESPPPPPPDDPYSALKSPPAPPPPPEDQYFPSGPVSQISPSLVASSPRNRTQLALGLGIGVPVLLVSIGILVFLLKKRKNTINRLEMEPPSRGGKDKDDHFNRSPAHHLNNYPGSPSTGVVEEFSKPTILPKTPLLYPVDEKVSVAALSYNLNSERQSQRYSRRTSSFNRKTIFNYEELFLATDKFSSNNLLGEGGFGNVYKGILGDGKEIAIKQLKLDSRQGEREFQAEVDTVSRVHHRHLVSLVGYCISGAKRLLVYEFVPNDTLDFHLHSAGGAPMSWKTRRKIALGCAKGLAYLHEDCQPKIIHRDIKSSNILLDKNFDAKVADFGLAKFYLDDETHISTRIMGTFGYLAPEYARTGQITEKSDVFSFGVVLLELITGHRPISKTNACHDDHIIDWARPLLKEALNNNNFDGVADPRLHKDYDFIEIARMVKCASACVHNLARCRPTMSQVVCSFEGVLSLDDLE